MSKPDLYNIDWASLSEDQKAKLDRALTEAEGIKLFQTSGRLGVGREWAPAAERLGARGGLSPEESTVLSRYRAWKSGQGPSKGLPRAPDSDEEIDQRAQAFQGSQDPEYRKSLMEAGKIEDARRSQDNYFADITARKALAEAHNAEREQRNAPVGPPLEAMNPPEQPAPTEVAAIKLAQAPVPMTRVAADSDPESKLGDAQLSIFQQLANTPYSNEAVASMAAPPAEESPTDAKLQENLRMLLQYGK